ncbi:hypothetical protein [Paenibacillus thiaminolyticus]|uniref:Uncharacterized protein n=1 Tax=Paenibacillus thiaminolyticus TaxID=49283 RepID=A0A3A3GBW4_PANTH|nr:hypothetical protein [Paenibacillus thiaminolyticus]RJG18973.1 hypothetical protein DQX05_26520 [Paenibacillus thiaminolyticus]
MHNLCPDTAVRHAGIILRPVWRLHRDRKVLAGLGEGLSVAAMEALRRQTGYRIIDLSPGEGQVQDCLAQHGGSALAWGRRV